MDAGEQGELSRTSTLDSPATKMVGEATAKIDIVEHEKQKNKS
jgi:hypothetical protein